MKNIQFVTAIHGNEPMPVLALASVGADQVVANQKALGLGKRFVEKDMNASFGTRGYSYEEKRARNLLRKIGKKSIVVDLHTFSTKSEPFVILVDLKMLDFARSLGLKHVVYMKHNIKKGHALINYREGVSVEVGQHSNPKSFETTLEIVKRLGSKKPKTNKVKVYEVYDRINRRGEYINFKMYNNSKDGFYPILAGENAYSFFGLKSRLLKV